MNGVKIETALLKIGRGEQLHRGIHFALLALERAQRAAYLVGLEQLYLTPFHAQELPRNGIVLGTKPLTSDVAFQLARVELSRLVRIGPHFLSPIELSVRKALASQPKPESDFVRISHATTLSSLGGVAVIKGLDSGIKVVNEIYDDLRGVTTAAALSDTTS